MIFRAAWLQQDMGHWADAPAKDPADPASNARTSTEPGAPASGAPVEVQGGNATGYGHAK